MKSANRLGTKVLLLLSTFTMAAVAPVVADCYGPNGGTGATGCANQYCHVSTFAAPYQGEEAQSSWMCCLNAANNDYDPVATSQSYKCNLVMLTGDSYPYGCCTVIAQTGACPGIQCNWAIG